LFLRNDVPASIPEDQANLIVEVFRMLADPTRIRVLWALSGAELEVTLPASGNGHSVIFASQTGRIPGFRPRLNPIGQRHDAATVPSAAYMFSGNYEATADSRHSPGTPLSV